MNGIFTVLFFLIITTIYAITKYYTQDNPVFLYIYVLVVMITQFFINLNLTKSICGSSQWTLAVLSTFIPWTFIFSILVYVISVFPGWLKPFSNTIGYGIALLAGLNTTINKIIKFDKKNTDDKISQMLGYIYADNSMLINEITPSNFDYFWDKMKSLFKNGVYSNNSLKNELLNMVRLKHIVAESIWYILTGLLVTSITYNYILNSECSQSADEMIRRHNKYKDDIENDKQESNPRIYSSYE